MGEDMGGIAGTNEGVASGSLEAMGVLEQKITQLGFSTSHQHPGPIRHTGVREDQHIQVVLIAGSLGVVDDQLIETSGSLWPHPTEYADHLVLPYGQVIIGSILMRLAAQQFKSPELLPDTMVVGILEWVD
jgi:hypothetical protein